MNFGDRVQVRRYVKRMALSGGTAYEVGRYIPASERAKEPAIGGWPGEPLPEGLGVLIRPGDPPRYVLEPKQEKHRDAVRLRRFEPEQPVTGVVVGHTYRREGIVEYDSFDGAQERYFAPERQVRVVQVAVEGYKRKGGDRARVLDCLEQDVTVIRPVPHIAISEFVATGYLQEVNRQLLHPLGLALEVIEEDGGMHLGGVWDYRDEPDGVVFSEVDAVKARRVAMLRLERDKERKRRLGFVIQPLDLSVDEVRRLRPGDEES